ncbi:MAG: hypothetical protein DDT23_01094 [candidate division WS2 bacterium]|nr:hypothetical protein [Candidatus Lithacetigena glycinireducens]
MEEEKEDLKPEEEKKLPPEPDLSGKEKPKSEEGGEEKKPPEDTVTISKSELEKIQTERENYRKAVIRLNKAKGRFLPGLEPSKPKEEEFGREEEEFVTKKELQQRDQKSAIIKACEDPEIDENWDEIIVYYRPISGTETVEEIVADIQRAKKAWRADNPLPEKPKVEKKPEAELAVEKGLGKGKEKEAKPPKKTIIPKKSKMEDWY